MMIKLVPYKIIKYLNRNNIKISKIKDLKKGRMWMKQIK